MKFRYWLADLISGGELTFQTNGWERSGALLVEANRVLDDGVQHIKQLEKGAENALTMGIRLHRIAALETPGANATVRKMARIAKGEL